MKNTLLSLLLLLTFIPAFSQPRNHNHDKSGSGTPQSAKDSIQVFYPELFKALKIGYLYRKTIDWKTLETETYDRLSSYNDFKSSLGEIQTIFDQIKANHCLVYRGSEKYTATKKIISKDRYTTEWRKKYDSKPAFDVKIIDGTFGYVLVPGMVFSDNSAAYIHQIAQPLYEQIAAIKTNTNIKGWIIDLRFNTGGNATPMLLALYDFFGDQKIWSELNINKRPTDFSKFKNGNYIQQSKVISYIKPQGELLDKAKVAVITGLFTGSSGEIVSIGFKGRANTLFIGEDTAGFTTGNVIWPLPFDTSMALTTGYDGDRNGNYYEYISPDVRVSKKDNFDNLLMDGNIQEAIRFIKTN